MALFEKGEEKKLKRQANAWIRKKINEGYTQQQLHHNVGVFSNKEKVDVMKNKKLSSKQYDKRYKFLFVAFSLLESKNY